ncbi:MAG: acyltransferase [Byssovorax sp.]
MPREGALRLLIERWRELCAPSALAAFPEAPARARLLGRPFIQNDGRLEIGPDLMMSSIPVTSHLVVSPGALLRIGARVRIAHGVAISAAAEIEIGDDVDLGPFCMILDSDYHDRNDRDAAGPSKPIRIGRGARLGAGVVVLRGAIIGDGDEIQAGSVVSRRLPEGVIAAGVPARPLGPARRGATPITSLDPSS